MPWIWTDSTWVKKGNAPVVIVFGRNPETGMTIKVGVQGFVPYFYAPGGNLVSADGEPIHRVEVQMPSDVPRLRARYPKTWEADILFDMRYLIDRGVFYGFDVQDGELVPVDLPVAVPRMHYYDIEVASPVEEFPDPQLAKYPIVTISTYDTYSGPRIFLLRDYDSETAMLLDWVNYIKETDPDALVGWFSGMGRQTRGFDLPYIFNRARRLNLYLDLSRLRTKRCSQYRIPGRQVLDMLQFFRDFTLAQGMFESYDLKSVAKKVCGFEYEDLGEKIKEYIDRGCWDEVAEYCQNDVEALRRIAEETQMWVYYETLRKICGLKLEDVLSRTKMVETLLMRHGCKPLPTRMKREKVSYKGAFVMEPRRGVHEDVAVMDYKSMYVSIILAFQVSPDIDRKIPEVVQRLEELREQLREKKRKGTITNAEMQMERTLKFVTNSFYGYMGFPGARLYDPEKAELITSKGQELVKRLFQMVGEDRVVYSDTDSAMIRVYGDPIVNARYWEQRMNEELRNWAQEQGLMMAPSVKYEKLYRRILFKAKKRYIGWVVDPEDKIEFKGVETRRSDSAELTKRLLNQFVDLVLKQGRSTEAVQLVKRAMEDVYYGRVDPREVAVPRSVSKEEYKNRNPWLEGRNWSREHLGIRFTPTTKPRLLYCRAPVREVCITEDTSPELLRGIEVDWPKMCEVVIVKKFKDLVSMI